MHLFSLIFFTAIRRCEDGNNENKDELTIEQQKG